MIRAAIALGSNSTRMLCARVEPSLVVPLGRGRVETLLFMGLDPGGALSPEALERAASAVAALKAQAEALGCPPGQIDLYATSAVRDASNRDRLAALLHTRCDLDMQVLSGEEEALFSFLAVSGGKDALVVDIGGGSTELTCGENGHILSSVSLQMGASRCLKTHPIDTADDARALTEILCGRMEKEAGDVLDCFRARPYIPLTGIGGTCTACRDMLCQNRPLFPDGPAMTLGNITLLRDLLAPLSREERARFRGLPPQRAAHIVHGLCILCAALAVFRPESVSASSLNNLDGWMALLASRPLPTG